MLGYEKLDCPKLSRDEQIRLTDLMKSGCVDSRNKLICSVIPWVLYLCKKFLGDYDEDFIQHCLFEVVNRMKDFDARKSSISTYVHRSVYWEFLDRLKAQRKTFNFEELPDVSRISDQELTDFEIDNILVKLPKKLRGVVKGWAWGVSFVDMAKKRGVTREIPRANFQAALRQLREVYDVD